MSFLSDPGEIEKKSFEIILGLLAGKGLAGPEKDVVMRVVHATADPDFADVMVFSDGAVASGIDALRRGCTIITDVKMLASGISGGGRGSVVCRISDPEIIKEAKEKGCTRAAAAMRSAASEGLMSGAIVAVGNAPTALYEAIRLVREDNIRPALIVGVPVGFVGAAESKEALLGLTEVPYITNRGRKGGSPVAAAIINALKKLS